jgi:dTDP-4-dehydrorhamnose reductase
MVRWVVAGSRGQLGSALCEQLEADPRAEIAAAVDLPEVDVSDEASVRRLFDGLGAAPDVVVNAAAYTHVDRCEREPEAAQRANAVAPGLLARACARLDACLVHVSTDYVFPGDAGRPYREDDATGPRSTYGRTKLEGERRVLAAGAPLLLVRTSWVFGRGRNFVAAVLEQAAARRRGEASGPLRVVDDQRGRPTYAVDLAEAIRGLLARDARGLYHVANDGIATWWDLARACLDEAGFGDVGVERIRTEDLDLAAARPAWSVLDLSKAAALGVRPRSWREALAAYLRSDASPLREAPRSS